MAHYHLCKTKKSSFFIVYKIIYFTLYLGNNTKNVLCNRKLYEVMKGDFLRLNCWISGKLYKLNNIVKIVKVNDNRTEMVFSIKKL